MTILSGQREHRNLLIRLHALVRSFSIIDLFVFFKYLSRQIFLIWIHSAWRNLLLHLRSILLLVSLQDFRTIYRFLPLQSSQSAGLKEEKEVIFFPRKSPTIKWNLIRHLTASLSGLWLDIWYHFNIGRPKLAEGHRPPRYFEWLLWRTQVLTTVLGLLLPTLEGLR